MKQYRLIDEFGGDEPSRKHRPALDHQPGDATRGDKLEHRRNIETSAALRAPASTTTPSAASAPRPRAPLRLRRRPIPAPRGRFAPAAKSAADASSCRARYDWRVFRHAGQSACEQRIVGKRRADADHDRIALRSQQMDAVAHLRAGNGNRPPTRRSDLAVGGNRELEYHVRAAFAHAHDMAGVITARLVGTGADIDHDAGRTQPRMSLPRHFGIRDLPWPRRRAPGLRRQWRRRRAAICRDASKAPASRTASRRARFRRRGAALRLRHAAGRQAGSSRGRR